MGVRRSSGFTIIETVLFLGITGLLVVAALVGTGAAVNNQRYFDAIETFKSILQDQYAELGSIKNVRDNTWNCGADARPVPEGSEIRGQSRCVIVGRYMTINRDAISIYSVVAYPRTTGGGGTDIQKMRTNYAYGIIADSVSEHTMEWGTNIAWPVSGSGARPAGTARTLSFFFVRSPESGNVYTFTSDTVPLNADAINTGTFTDMLQAGNTIPGQGNRTICIASSGLFVGGDMAIAVGTGATSSSAVEVRSNKVIRDLGGDSQC